MKLRISHKIRAARRRAQIPAPATLSTDLLAQVLYPSPTLTLECRDAFQRLVDETVSFFQPANCHEAACCDDIAHFRWAIDRAKSVQTAALELTITGMQSDLDSSYSNLTNPARISLASARLLKDSKLLPYLDRHLAQLSARLDESLNRMAFYRNLQNEKNANFAQLPSNQADTCKNAISEPSPEEQPS
ncbi:MAG: hypothetical protein JNN08_12450 [Bryobacterales bacterium]|nr:hypothetical protein [Bryobacterales bacterium]